MPGQGALGRWLPPAPPVWRFGAALLPYAALPESIALVHCFLLPVTLIASVASLFDPSRDALLGSI